MALTNIQYNIIMRNYEETRLRNQHILDDRKLIIEKEIPEYIDLEYSISQFSVSYLENLLNFSDTTQNDYHNNIHEIHEKKRNLLQLHGYSPDYLDPIFSCPLCQDTGYIGQEKCNCFKQQALELMYANSNMYSMIQDCDFSLISDNYYHGEDLNLFYQTLDTCKNFVETFSYDYQNLVLYGTVGTGKSFLASCIAKDLLTQNYTVLYFSAISLFETLGKYTFDKDSLTTKATLANIYEDLYNSDLIIIDDLGSEMTNTFIVTQLFSFINERHSRKKSTIITTNYSLSELQEHYTDRIFSRLVGNYITRKLNGNDIRIIKKM